MIKKATYLFIGLLLFFIVDPPVVNGKEQNDEAIVTVDSDFFKKSHSLEDLKEVVSRFDTYDYVRTKNQKEELVLFLLKQFEEHDYPIGVARCKNILGVLRRDQAKYAEAIELHESALELSGKDTVLLIYSLNNLGVVYRRLDKPRMALDYHMNALELAEAYKADIDIARRSSCVALNSIGNINLSLNQPEKALEVFRQTLSIEQELGNHLGMAINYQNIGYSFEAMGRTDLAIEYYERSLKENEIINSNVGRCICYNSIGEIELKQDEPYKALETFKKAMIFAEKNADDYYISQTHANIGKAYLALGSYNRALVEFETFQKIALEIESRYLIQDAYRWLSKLYEETGDFQAALENYKIAVAYNDSILNEKSSRYLNELQTLYEAEKKQQQIEFLTVENKVKTQRNYFYLLFALTFLLVLVVVYTIKKRKADLRNNELEARLFRSLMNPHFIFNALGSIQSFLYKNEAQKAASYLGSFSKLTRAILQNSNKELITLEEEINALTNYIEIEQMRLRDCFLYEIIIDEKIELDFIYVLPTMLQPFVENAIHHGLSRYTEKEGLLKVELLLKDDNYIRIKIQDNGKGIKNVLDKGTNTRHKSMGMNIFKERARVIEKKYKKTVIFDICDISDIDQKRSGTLVTIDFPIIEPDD